MKTKIFIDGSEGTTGLKIYERFKEREDIELLTISTDLRKDVDERRRLINASDITFLCLPDVAARESAALAKEEHVRIIDASTAHRTEDGWIYGFPELSKEHRNLVKTGKRISVPGCHATGFISLLYPLISGEIMPVDYPVSCFSITGYSGGGKKLIADYEDANRTPDYSAPRAYALEQQHKHLKEMQVITGLAHKPLFSPILGDYYRGMIVGIPLHMHLLSQYNTPEQLHGYFAEYYNNEKFIHVMPFGTEISNGALSGNQCAHWDGLKIYILGNQERPVLYAQFDNLGKGASGAAIQCLNVMLGCEEDKGLNIAENPGNT